MAAGGAGGAAGAGGAGGARDWGARLLGQPQGRLNVILGGLLLLVSVQRVDQKWFYEGELREAQEKLAREERRSAQLTRELAGLRARVLGAVEGGGWWGLADRVRGAASAEQNPLAGPFLVPAAQSAARSEEGRRPLERPMPTPELAGGAPPRMI